MCQGFFSLAFSHILLAPCLSGAVIRADYSDNSLRVDVFSFSSSTRRGSAPHGFIHPLEKVDKVLTKELSGLL